MTHERLYSVGTKIKEIRESKGMTCTELAEKVGVGKQHVYKIERDIIKHQPYPTIKAYADALNVNPAYLVGWSNSIERTPDIITEEVNSEII